MQLFYNETYQFRLLKRLLKAAEIGECPDKSCLICQEKQSTIEEAKSYIKYKEAKEANVEGN